MEFNRKKYHRTIFLMIVMIVVCLAVFSGFATKADGTPFEYKTNEFWMLIISVFPMIIVSGTICMVLLCRKKKSAENAAKAAA